MSPPRKDSGGFRATNPVHWIVKGLFLGTSNAQILRFHPVGKDDARILAFFRDFSRQGTEQGGNGN